MMKRMIDLPASFGNADGFELLSQLLPNKRLVIKSMLRATDEMQVQGNLLRCPKCNIVHWDELLVRLAANEVQFISECPNGGNTRLGVVGLSRKLF